MRKLNIIFVFLFIILIPINYLSIISGHLPQFQETLELRSTSGIPIYLTSFQMWVYDIISLLFDLIIIAITVGLVSYYFKDINIYIALLFGIFSKYIYLLGILLYSSIHNGDNINISFLTVYIKSLDFRQSILLSLQIPLTLYFSYLGYNYGKRSDYFDPKDKELYYFYGLPKKIWLLLFISMTPVAKFLSKLTIVQIYEVTKKISGINYWKDTFSLRNIFSEDSAMGIGGLLGHIILIFITWTIAVTLFFIGLNAIKNKDAKLRWLIISSIFILIPSMIITIELLRNRTWFF